MVNSNDGIKTEANIDYDMDTWEPWMPAISGRSIQHYKIDFISSLSQNLWSDCQQSFRSIYEVPTCLKLSTAGQNNQCRILLLKERVGSVIQWSVFTSRRSVNRWILVQRGFDRSLIWKWIWSKGTPQIRNPDPDSPTGTHPKTFTLGLFMEKIKMSCCIPSPVSFKMLLLKCFASFELTIDSSHQTPGWYWIRF